MTAKYTISFAHDSGLPEDVSTNSFYFPDPLVLPTDFNADVLNIENFYNFITGGNNLVGFMSENLTGAYTIKAYKLSDPEPRVPYGTKNGTFTGMGLTAMPSEVSMVISYHGLYISGTPNARRRGRLYLGPLAYVTRTSDTDPTPSTAFRTACTNAASKLRADSGTAGRPWQQFSRTLNAATNVVGGWVDNAYDTQRRRGERATARSTWT